jgi:hypothetical protein
MANGSFCVVIPWSVRLWMVVAQFITSEHPEIRHLDMIKFEYDPDWERAVQAWRMHPHDNWLCERIADGLYGANIRIKQCS